MTKEIKKAIALEVAKAFITELTKFGGDYPESAGTNIVPDAYKTLREIEQVLNPEPEKPSREEVIESIRKLKKHFNDGKCNFHIDTAIPLLQEPQPNKWIKNTGVEGGYTLTQYIKNKLNKTPDELTIVEALEVVRQFTALEAQEKANAEAVVLI